MIHKDSFLHNNTEQLPYMVTVPSDFSPDEHLPLIVFLHGAGERGTDLQKINVHGIPKLFGANPDYRGLRAVTLSPQCPPDDVWSAHVFALRALIEHVTAEYGCDPNRVSITGISMGGFGTWYTAMAYPTLFAAIAPCCGGGMAWNAEVLTMPVWAFHGLKDRAVDPRHTIEMAEKLEKCNPRFKCSLYEGVGHDSWRKAFGEETLAWMLAQKK